VPVTLGLDQQDRRVEDLHLIERKVHVRGRVIAPALRKALHVQQREAALRLDLGRFGVLEHFQGHGAFVDRVMESVREDSGQGRCRAAGFPVLHDHSPLANFLERREAAPLLCERHWRRRQGDDQKDRHRKRAESRVSEPVKCHT
jgi:hypothetical protein